MLSFRCRDEFFLVTFFKVNIPCILLVCIQAGIYSGARGDFMSDRRIFFT